MFEDLTILKTGLFYPMFYFIYRNCRLDLRATRQLIVISLAVAAVADIAADTATVAEDGSVTSSLLGNDTFEATPTITAVTNGAHGTVEARKACLRVVHVGPPVRRHPWDEDRPRP